MREGEGVGAPLREALPLAEAHLLGEDSPLREGDAEGQRVAGGEGEAQEDAGGLRDCAGDDVSPAVAVVPPVPLREGELQPLADGLVVRNALREAHGVAEAQAVARAETEGEDVKVGDVLGRPLADAHGEPLREGEPHALTEGLPVPGALRVAHGVTEAKAVAGAETEDEAVGVEDALGRPLADAQEEPLRDGELQPLAEGLLEPSAL